MFVGATVNTFPRSAFHFLLLIGVMVVFPARAENPTRTDLWNCAVFGQCPKGLSPNRARTGLDNHDQDGLDKVIRLRKQVERQGLIECAAGGQCPPDMSPEQADAIVDASMEEPSDDETIERARRCYVYGDCREDLVSGDIKETLPEFEQRKLEAEKTRQIAREKVAFEWEIRKCATSGQCKRPLTPENARKFDQLGALDQALQRCAAGYGCPEGINKSRARALTDSDYDRWKEQEAGESKERSGTTDLTFDEEEGTAVEVKKEQDTQPDIPQPDLVFEDPALDWPQRDQPKKSGADPRSPIKSANPNIGIAGYVIAEAGPQQTPAFFSPQELLASRLPSIDGGEVYDPSLVQQDPGLEKPGEPVPVTDLTIETIASPFNAPGSFRIERKNEHRDRSDLEKVSATLRGKIDSYGPVPRVLLSAEIITEQISTERFGAKAIVGGAPDGDIEAMAYLPIDDGGPAINVSLAIAAKLPDRSMHAGVMPYTEDLIANIGLTQQILTILSARNNAQELSATRLAHRLAGLEQPATGTFGDFVDFTFPETTPGKPRGFLVFLSGQADPETISRTNMTRGFDKVTVIKRKGSQKATIGVLVETVWPVD